MSLRTYFTSERLFLWVGTILGFGAAVCAVTLGWWLLDRSVPMAAVSGTFSHWEEGNPRIGHVIWRGIRKRACPGTIYRYIVDGEIVQLDPRPMPYPGPVDPENNVPTSWDASFRVPDHINHDASYRNRIEFICNPIHKFMPIVVAPPDVPFKLHESAKNTPSPSHSGAVPTIDNRGSMELGVTGDR